MNFIDSYSQQPPPSPPPQPDLILPPEPEELPDRTDAELTEVANDD
ncbi:MAG: hypothetical protein Q8Q60_05445 [Candidatus Chromulinivorax sp.]|nr:hypothetical protein [Candidatus Chromulinivorax sp.]